MKRIALLFVLTLPMGACQLALPIAATQVAVPVATSQTVLRGNTQTVEIRTEPPGATVNIPGYAARTTPAFITLSRGHSHTVSITKDGYKPVTTNLTSQLASADPTTTTVIGSALDQVSGAAWELNPNRLTLTLESLTPPTTGATATASATVPQPQVNPQAKVATAAVTPPIVPQPTVAGAATTPVATAAVLADQIARLNRLLEQGVITKHEHEVLIALATGATTIAGAPGSQ